MKMNLQYFSTEAANQRERYAAYQKSLASNSKSEEASQKNNSLAAKHYSNYGPEDSSAIQNGFDYNGTPISGLDLSGINWSQPASVDFDNPSEVYSATNGLGNSVYPASFSDITLNVPAWVYNNNDGVAGEGVLTFASFQGKTKSHVLYRDINTGQYFYVTRHGKNNGSGGEPSDRASLSCDLPPTAPNSLSIPTDRNITDATVGTDDSYESSEDSGRTQACVVFVDDPHLSRIQYMDCVYPHWDNPAAKGVTLNSAAQGDGILHETYDDPNLTPKEDSESNSSPASGATQNSNNGTGTGSSSK